MTSEQAKAAAELMTTVWEGEFPATCAVLAAVKNDNRNYKPDAKSRSAWEIATHLATADIWFIDSILNGASPADLPVQNMPKIEFAINLETARRLGIKPPQEMIIRAYPVYR